MTKKEVKKKMVKQTRFGSSQSPPGQRGNCFAACLASILNMPLEDVIDVSQYEDDWFERLNAWLEPFNLACIYIKATIETSELFGYHIGDVESTIYKGGGHVVVISDGVIVNDPNPKAKKTGKPLGVFVFVVRDAGRMLEMVRPTRRMLEAVNHGKKK